MSFRAHDIGVIVFGIIFLSSFDEFFGAKIGAGREGKKW